MADNFENIVQKAAILNCLLKILKFSLRNLKSNSFFIKKHIFSGLRLRSNGLILDRIVTFNNH